jgi:hypothetical protein
MAKINVLKNFVEEIVKLRDKYQIQFVLHAQI